MIAGIWPVWTALVFAVGGALGVEWLRSRRRASGDLALALFFYSGIALGVVLVSLGGGLNANLLTYLFGQPLTVNDSELVVILVLGAVIVVAMLLLRRVLFAVVTDEDWSRVSGLPVGFVNNVLAVLTAVAVVAAMRIVGILLIAAMMVLAGGERPGAGSVVRLHAPMVDRGQRHLGDRRVGRVQDLGNGPRRDHRAHRGRCVRGGVDREARRRAASARDRGGRTMMPTVTSDLHATIETRLHDVGQRYTPKRRALVDMLRRAGKPVSMTDVVSGRSAPPQSSAYRNLAVLEQAGVVRRVITEGEFARFELTEELTEHHHHLICSRCGRVEDVTVPSDLEGTLDKTLDRLAKRAGFADVDHRLDLIGTCGDCAGADLSCAYGVRYGRSGCGIGWTSLASTRISLPSG